MNKEIRKWVSDQPQVITALAYGNFILVIAGMVWHVPRLREYTTGAILPLFIFSVWNYYRVRKLRLAGKI